MKLYKKEYKAPEILLLFIHDKDILTTSPGTETPILDEEPLWGTGK